MLDKAVVIKTCVPVVVRGLQPQVVIALRTVQTFAAAALREKSWYQRCVLNVLRAKQPLALMPRAMLALRVNTKTKTAQEQNTVVKIVVPEHTAIKTNKYPPLRVKFALLDVGHLPSVMVLALVSMAAQPATWANTTH